MRLPSGPKSPLLRRRSPTKPFLAAAGRGLRGRLWRDGRHDFLVEVIRRVLERETTAHDHAGSGLAVVFLLAAGLSLAPALHGLFVLVGHGRYDLPIPEQDHYHPPGAWPAANRTWARPAQQGRAVSAMAEARRVEPWGWCRWLMPWTRSWLLQPSRPPRHIHRAAQRQRRGRRSRRASRPWRVSTRRGRAGRRSPAPSSWPVRARSPGRPCGRFRGSAGGRSLFRWRGAARPCPTPTVQRQRRERFSIWCSQQAWRHSPSRHNVQFIFGRGGGDVLDVVENSGDGAQMRVIVWLVAQLRDERHISGRHPAELACGCVGTLQICFDDDQKLLAIPNAEHLLWHFSLAVVVSKWLDPYVGPAVYTV